jgi:MoxR-like ATPase
MTDDQRRGETYRPHPKAIEMVNAALALRRPLLVTGKPGSGKSTLAYSVARELRLGPVLRWNITSRTVLKDGLYEYDALARLNDYSLGEQRSIGDYIRLGPLGTTLLPYCRPRVLLIDEIDKSDIDLPNDLLNIFEEGSFIIPELFRLRDREEHIPVLPADSDVPVTIRGGRVRCTAFPFVVMTNNGEREFPPPFLRRCLRLRLPRPDDAMLARILEAHLPLGPEAQEERRARQQLILDFLRRAQSGDLATDQLMNAVFMTIGPTAPLGPAATIGVDDGIASAELPEAVAQVRERLIDVLLQHLHSTELDTEDDPGGRVDA